MFSSLMEIFLVYTYWFLCGRILIRDAGLISQFNPVYHMFMRNAWTKVSLYVLCSLFWKTYFRDEITPPSCPPPFLHADTDRACVAGWCCRESERAEEEEEGSLHAHLWWAVISRPCGVALVFLHPRRGEGFRLLSRRMGWGLNSGEGWRCSARQLGAGGV